MKKVKKLAALVLSFVIAMTFTVSVFADSYGSIDSGYGVYAELTTPGGYVVSDYSTRGMPQGYYVGFNETRDQTSVVRMIVRCKGSDGATWQGTSQSLPGFGLYADVIVLSGYTTSRNDSGTTYYVSLNQIEGTSLASAYAKVVRPSSRALTNSVVAQTQMKLEEAIALKEYK